MCNDNASGSQGHRQPTNRRVNVPIVGVAWRGWGPDASRFDQAIGSVPQEPLAQPRQGRRVIQLNVQAVWPRDVGSNATSGQNPRCAFASTDSKSSV